MDIDHQFEQNILGHAVKAMGPSGRRFKVSQAAGEPPREVLAYGPDPRRSLAAITR
jgi:hypothetical protein